MRTLIISLAFFLVWLLPSQAQITKLWDKEQDSPLMLSNCAEDWPDTYRKHEVCTDYLVYAWTDSVTLITRSSLLNWTIGSFNFSGTLKYVVPPAEELAFNLLIINPLGDTVYNRLAHYQIIGENWSFAIGFLEYVYTDENIILADPVAGLYTVKSVIKATQFTDHTVTLNFSIDNPVPVELTSFTATLTNNDVTLSWSTVTEVNCYGFALERQALGYNYEPIAFIQGHGNSNSPKKYSYSDKNLLAGQYLYRLKQIDLDGAFEYFGPVVVSIGPPLSYNLEQNYPNPFNPTTTIRYSLPTAAQVKLVVYNILGQEVASLINQELPAGNHAVNFDATHLPSGTYLYKLQTGSYTGLKKMSVLK